MKLPRQKEFGLINLLKKRGKRFFSPPKRIIPPQQRNWIERDRLTKEVRDVREILGNNHEYNGAILEAVGAEKKSVFTSPVNRFYEVIEENMGKDKIIPYNSKLYKKIRNYKEPLY